MFCLNVICHPRVNVGMLLWEVIASIYGSASGQQIPILLNLGNTCYMLQRIDAQNQEKSTRKMWEMYSQLTIKTPDQLY